MINMDYIESMLSDTIREAIATDFSDNVEEPKIDKIENKNQQEPIYDDSLIFSEDPKTTLNHQLSILSNQNIESLSEINEIEYMNTLNTYYNTIKECNSIIDNTLKELNIAMDQSSFSVDPNNGDIIFLNEAFDIRNEIRKRWDSLLQFLEQLFQRFQEAITNILINNKGYLDKYRNIILGTKWRTDQTFQYDGNYKEAVNRCMNTPVPEFQYETYAPSLRTEGYNAAIQRFMAGKGFKFNDNNNDIPGQFKSYFLALEYDTTKGNFSQLNPRELFDYCYNINNIMAIIRKDRDTMRRGVNQLLNAVNRDIRLNSAQNNTNQQTNINNTTNQNTNTIGTNNTGINTTTGGAVNASAIIDNNGNWIVHEDRSTIISNANNNISSSFSNSQSSIQNTNLKIGGTNPNANKKPKSTMMTTDMNNIINKWTLLCKSLISAKLTAIQKIGKDYMTIIKAHVKANVNTQQQQQIQNQPQPQAQYNNQ